MSTTSVQRPPRRELFFAPLQIFLEPNDYERVRFAYKMSKAGHAKQLRDDGTRYFDHPKSAAWIYIDELGGRDPEMIILLLLHDISEDSWLLSPYRIRINFGEEMALDVRAVTKLRAPKEDTREYLLRVIARGPRPILAKLCDRLHNMRTLGACSEDKRERMTKETHAFHIPMLAGALSKYGAPWDEYARKIEMELL